MTQPAPKSTPSRWEGDLSEERTHRLWRGVHTGLTQKRRIPVPLRVAGGLALAALVLLSWVTLDPASLWGGGASPSPVDGPVASGALLHTQAAPMAMTIEDGSELSMEAESTVQLLAMSPERVELGLRRGSVSCDVKKEPKRSFSVVAGDVEVRVVGTKFSVHRGTTEAEDGSQVSKVSVAVQRGIVEIYRRGQSQRVRRLVAGQTWSTEERVSAPAAGSERQDSKPSEVSAEEPPTGAEEPAFAAGASELSLDEGGMGRPASGTEKASRSEKDSGAERTIGALPAGDVAKRRFEAATNARRAGDPRRAATIYEEFLREHPGDPRAGLAAFELGRLQMDSLGNSAAALGALRQALRLSPGASFREDVLARITRAYARMGRGEACSAARDAYQREFPGGVHRQELDTLCR